jgi:hypothetical protein
LEPRGTSRPTLVHHEVNRTRSQSQSVVPPRRIQHLLNAEEVPETKISSRAHRPFSPLIYDPIEEAVRSSGQSPQNGHSFPKASNQAGMPALGHLKETRFPCDNENRVALSPASYTKLTGPRDLFDSHASVQSTRSSLSDTARSDHPRCLPDQNAMALSDIGSERSSTSLAPFASMQLNPRAKVTRPRRRPGLSYMQDEMPSRASRKLTNSVHSTTFPRPLTPPFRDRPAPRHSTGPSFLEIPPPSTLRNLYDDASSLMPSAASSRSYVVKPCWPSSSDATPPSFPSFTESVPSTSGHMEREQREPRPSGSIYVRDSPRPVATDGSLQVLDPTRAPRYEPMGRFPGTSWIRLRIPVWL